VYSTKKKTEKEGTELKLRTDKSEDTVRGWQSWGTKRADSEKGLKNRSVLSREWKSVGGMKRVYGESTEEEDVTGLGTGESEIRRLGWG